MKKKGYYSFIGINQLIILLTQRWVEIKYFTFVGVPGGILKFNIWESIQIHTPSTDEAFIFDEYLFMPVNIQLSPTYHCPSRFNDHEYSWFSIKRLDSIFLYKFSFKPSCGFPASGRQCLVLNHQLLTGDPVY